MSLNYGGNSIAKHSHYKDSPAMAITEEDAAAFDATLEPMEKKWQASQGEFYIMSRSFVE